MRAPGPGDPRYLGMMDRPWGPKLHHQFGTRRFLCLEWARAMIWLGAMPSEAPVAVDSNVVLNRKRN